MPKILQSYQKGELALEDWTDDMLTTLPGWSGWTYENYNVYYWWDDAITNHYAPIGQGVVSIPAGGGQIVWDMDRKIFTPEERNNVKLIAHRPYMYANGWYYIRGDLRNSYSEARYYSIARCTSIPGA